MADASLRGGTVWMGTRFQGHGVRSSAALLGYAADTPRPKRFVTHDVPIGSVSEFIMTNTGWHIIEEGRQSFK
ncbi:hypothetical protein [Candidatus Nitrospira allomarina]|uniref:Uncharacterized protein n=1 Tax=Candidatus Nitrospira allomarina TaxID=3020900 RepID=A0AA96JXC7_9BACT|nr:hypothetical protein [Candidatus Nitrospira allomarina]WNM56564.1 hypothetical protein PP769_11290 [Candidatus Nitrospira allomarina]